MVHQVLSRPVACLALLLMAASVRGLDVTKAPNQFVRDVWQVTSGLPQNTIQTLAQGGDGYLWIGTEEGLARFDGVRIRAFDRATHPGMPSQNIWTLLPARDGRVLAGTYGGGLLVFDGHGFKAMGEKQGLPGSSVTDLAEARDGTVFVGTDRGLARLRGGRLEPFGGPDLGTIKRLLVGRQGELWVGTDAGLVRIAGGRSRTYSTRDGLPANGITALCQDASGRLWVGTPRGLVQLQGERFHTPSGSEGPGAEFVSALATDRDGSLWIGTDRGLGRLWQGRFEPLTDSEGATVRLVTSLLEDREGDLWVGTRGRGLVRLKQGDFTTYGTGQGLPAEIVDAVHGAEDGGLWLGGYGGHLSHLSPAGKVTVLPVHDALGATGVRALLRTRDGTLWAGSWLGLLRLRGGRFEEVGADGLTNVRALLEDATGALWIGTDSGGLFRRQGQATRHWTTQNGLPSNQIRALHQDRQGRLWIGTYGGLCLFESDRCTTYATGQGLPGNLVRALYEDVEGALWVGTYGNGLARIKDGRVAAWTSATGLPSDIAYGIVEDDRGNLWVSCNRGVYRVSKRDLEDFAAGRISRVSAVSYVEADGLASRECNGGNPSAWKTSDGRLWFVTIRGAVVVDPARLRSDRPVPPALLEQLRVDGQEVALGAAIVLPPGKRALEFHYTGLSLADGGRLRFRYRLDGFDPEWVEAADRRIAYYTGLPSGRYRFEVATSFEGEPWSAKTATLALTLEPRLFETRLFYVLAGLGAVLLGVFMQQNRVRRSRGRERELRKEVEAALARIKVLSGLLPICAWCKKIRDDHGRWNPLESFIHDRSEADFTHGICPECRGRMSERQ